MYVGQKRALNWIVLQVAQAMKKRENEKQVEKAETPPWNSAGPSGGTLYVRQ